MPSLRQIELAVNYSADQSLCDGYQWEIFIMDQLVMLIRFDFKFQLIWTQIHNDDEESILAPFRTSFWIGKQRQWFVVYDYLSRSLFTVPRFARTSCTHECEPVLPYITTLPIEQHAIFYDHITELSLGYSNASSYRYRYVRKLLLTTPNFDKQLIDLSKVEYLTVQMTGCTLEILLELINQWMPTVSHLIIESHFSWNTSDRINAMSLVNIRTLNLSNYGNFSYDENFYWTQFFPNVERLIIHINTRRQMTILIDRFEHLSSASFFVANCQISTTERLREPQVTREWIVENTHSLSINSSFTCQIDYQIDYQYRSWIHLWIGDHQNQLKKTKKKKRLYHCFTRCLFK